MTISAGHQFLRDVAASEKTDRSNGWCVEGEFSGFASNTVGAKKRSQ
jgi:hypothetical protein